MGHLEDILARLPKATDPDEVRIVNLLQEELLATSWSQEFFTQARQAQIEFLKFALSHLQDQGAIHKRNQELLKQISELGKARIVSGEEHLAALEPGKPIMIASNHLGDYKLSPIQPQELGLELPIDQIHPFPMYFAPYSPIARRLAVELFDAHVELPKPLYSIQKACSLITIVAVQSGGLARLENDTRVLFENNPRAALVVFPEGGTSGKRNGGGPYNLEEFHAGAFVIAGNLGIPILPVGKYFSAESGYELGILPPLRPEPGKNRGYYKELATSTQDALRNWLDKRKEV